MKEIDIQDKAIEAVKKQKESSKNTRTGSIKNDLEQKKNMDDTQKELKLPIYI